MKNKPLALFTGAALTTLAALAGLKTTNWPAGSETAPETAKSTGEAQTPATGEPSQATEKPVETAAIPAPEPPKAEAQAEAKPELDTVRVESDGQTIVAGRAEPGAEIALKLGDQVIGKGIATPDGSWVVVPDQPLPKGAHEITVEQKAADSAPVLAEQSIAVAVPDKPGQQAMVALTEPGSATKVLQAGGYEEQASLSQTAARPEPDPSQEPSRTPETSEPAQEAPKTDEPASIVQKPAESTELVDEAQQPSQTTSVAKTEELPEAVKPPEEPAPARPESTETARNVPLSLDAVDYNDKGDIIFSGRAKAGTAVRLYVDNSTVGDAIVDGQGSWQFTGKDIIAPGAHDLRADQIDKTGKVIARIELPFLRENAEAVAALNTPPEPVEAEAEPQQTAEAEPALQANETQPQTTQEQTPQTAQPAAEQPPQTAAEQASQTASEPPPQKTAGQSPQPTSEAPQTTAEPLQTAPPPEAEPPQQQTEVAKAEPEVSDPAPDQPAAETKTEDVTTTAAVTAEQAALDPGKPRTGKIVIQPGNNLWKLSRVIYGRGINFTVIYQANKDQIRDPDEIYPGQIFTIPDASPPETIDPKRKEPLTSAEGGAAQ
jgi:nucleoid-associated protein YgaU